jgi:hypothetical protein
MTRVGRDDADSRPPRQVGLSEWLVGNVRASWELVAQSWALRGSLVVAVTALVMWALGAPALWIVLSLHLAMWAWVIAWFRSSARYRAERVNDPIAQLRMSPGQIVLYLVVAALLSVAMLFVVGLVVGD